MAADGSIIIDTQIDKTGLNTGMIALGNLAAKGIATATKAIATEFNRVFDVGKSFEAAMSEVQAISGATGDELLKLANTAKEYGATTSYTATDCANALKYMALAGWDADTSIEALPGVLNMAAASGMDLATASDAVTDNLSAFGLEAKDATHLADLMASAQATVNTSAQQLTEAWSNCAANMHAAGQDVETTTAALMLLADQGLKGSQAGTVMSAIMRDITNKMEDGKIMIGDTAVAVMDAEGNFRDFNDIVADVAAATDGMGTAERSAALSTTFTARSITGMNMILNAGVDELNAYENGLRNCDDAAVNMAATMKDNLVGDLEKWSSAVEALYISVYESINGIAREVVQTGTEMVTKLNDAFNNAGFEGFSQALGECLADALNFILSYVPQMISAAISLIAGLINGIAQSTPQIIDSAFNIIDALIIGIVQAIPQVITAAGNIVGGIITGLGNALLGLISTLIAAIPQIITGIVDSLSTFVTTIIQAGINLLSSLVQGMPQTISTIQAALPQIIVGICSVFTQLAPSVSQAGVALLSALIQNLPQIISTIAASIPQIVSSVCSTLSQSVGTVAQAGVQLFSGLIQSIPQAIPGIIASIGQIVSSIISALTQSLPEIISCIGIIISTIAQNLPQYAVAIIKVIPPLILQIVKAIIQCVPQFLQAGVDLVKGLVNGIGQAISSAVQSVVGFFKGIIDGVKNLFGVHSPSTVFADIGKGLVEGLLNGVKNLISSATTDIVNLFNGIWTKVKDGATKAWSAITSTLSNAWNGIKNTASNVWNGITTTISTATENVKNKVTTAWNTAKTTVTNVWNDIKTTASTVWTGITTTVSTAVTNAKDKATTLWNNAKTTITTTWNTLKSTASTVWNGMTTTISGEANNVKTALSNTWSNVKSTASTAWNGICSTCTNIFGKLPSSVLSIGSNIVSGLWNGIKDKAGWLADKVKGFASGILNGIKGVFGIHSPSKVMREVIGRNLGIGLAEGIEDTQPKVNNALTSLLAPKRAVELVQKLNLAVENQHRNVSTDAMTSPFYSQVIANSSPTAEEIAIAVSRHVWNDAPNLDVKIDGEKAGAILEPRVSKIQASKTIQLNRRDGLAQI